MPGNAQEPLDSGTNSLLYRDDMTNPPTSVYFTISVLAEMGQRIERLLEMLADLARLIAACPGGGKPERCPILSSPCGDAPVAE